MRVDPVGWNFDFGIDIGVLLQKVQKIAACNQLKRLAIRKFISSFTKATRCYQYSFGPALVKQCTK